MTMRTNRSALSRPLWTCLVLLCLPAAPLSAEQFGLFTYEAVGSSVTIADYPEDEIGDVEIPNEIDGKPVTRIGGSAFSGCSGLTAVSIPGSVTTIGDGAFSGCSGLTSVSIPEGVTEIGYYAFSGCTSLHSAIFLGDAPGKIDANTFANAAPGFTIFYLSCGTGFTSPTWNGYPAVRIDERACPAAAWLAGHDLPYDTDLHQDLNNDGVSLLMAYALDLDPNLNLRGRLPEPVKGEDTMCMSFYAAAESIAYTVQTSADLRAWTTEGVALSDLRDDGTRTASVSLDRVERFMRLVVAD